MTAAVPSAVPSAAAGGVSGQPPRAVEGRADPGGDQRRVAEQLLPGEVDDLVTRFTQQPVPLELCDRLAAALVLEQPVSLRDHVVLAPEKIHSADESPVLTGDMDLQFRRRQSLITEGDPRAGLQHGLRAPVREIDDLSRLANAGPAFAPGQ